MLYIYIYSYISNLILHGIINNLLFTRYFALLSLIYLFYCNFLSFKLISLLFYTQKFIILTFSTITLILLYRVFETFLLASFYWPATYQLGLTKQKSYVPFGNKFAIIMGELIKWYERLSACEAIGWTQWTCIKKNGFQMIRKIALLKFLSNGEYQLIVRDASFFDMRTYVIRSLWRAMLLCLSKLVLYMPTKFGPPFSKRSFAHAI